MKLNHDQRKQLAEISGNIAVAWFSAGIIAPFFLRNLSIGESLSNFGSGLFSGSFFTFLSLFFIKRRSK